MSTLTLKRQKQHIHPLLWIVRGAWKWLLRTTLLLLLLLAPLVLTAQQWMPALGAWLAYPQSAAPAEAIVIYGGNRERTDYGLELYQQSMAPEVWRTGYGSSREGIIQLALREGVPPEDFLWLETYSTWEDGAEIAATIQQRNVESVLLITDWWHSRRAVCSAQIHLGESDVTLYYTSSPSQMPDRPDNWWRSRYGWYHVSSELGKFGFYWLRYGMNPWEC
jgi:uncharacterized SAM-binding protein YcdF (DUF218 family)